MDGERSRPGCRSARPAPNTERVKEPNDRVFSRVRVSREARLTAPEAGALPVQTNRSSSAPHARVSRTEKRLTIIEDREDPAGQRSYGTHEFDLFAAETRWEFDRWEFEAFPPGKFFPAAGK